MIMGSGLKNKVLEAFILSRSVVSTQMGIESLPVTQNEQCLIADTPELFAECVIKLLENPEQRTALGQSAKQFVIKNYTWQSVGETLNKLLETL